MQLRASRAAHPPTEVTGSPTDGGQHEPSGTGESIQRYLAILAPRLLWATPTPERATKRPSPSPVYHQWSISGPVPLSIPPREYWISLPALHVRRTLGPAPLLTAGGLCVGAASRSSPAADPGRGAANYPASLAPGHRPVIGVGGTVTRERRARRVPAGGRPRSLSWHRWPAGRCKNSRR